MELQQIAALAILLVVVVLSATPWVHRAAVALAGAVLLAAAGLSVGLIPDVLLTAAGLMILSGYLKRSGLASWMALKAAKLGRGRPGPILILTALLSYLVSALLGPMAAVALVVPVVLLLASELDTPPLPFVVVLSWAALLGGATTLTSQAGNLWLGYMLDVDGAEWLFRLLPYTASAMAATLLTALVVFRRQLRVTNERRARVLEYDEAQSLSDRILLVKTICVLALVVVGLVLGPWLGVSTAVVVVGGAALLWLLDSPRSNILGDLDGLTLLYFASFMLVAGAVVTSGLPSLTASVFPSHPLGILGITGLLGAFVDHGAVAGVTASFLQASGLRELWPFVILGTSLGAGTTIWGALSTGAALGLAGHGPRKTTWQEYTKYSLVFAAVNFVVLSGLALLN